MTCHSVGDHFGKGFYRDPLETVFDTLRLDDRSFSFAKIDRIKTTFPVLFPLLVKVLLLQSRVNVDADEFRAKSWINRRS